MLQHLCMLLQSRLAVRMLLHHFASRYSDHVPILSLTLAAHRNRSERAHPRSIARVGEQGKHMTTRAKLALQPPNHPHTYTHILDGYNDTTHQHTDFHHLLQGHRTEDQQPYSTSTLHLHYQQPLGYSSQDDDSLLPRAGQGRPPSQGLVGSVVRADLRRGTAR